MVEPDHLNEVDDQQPSALQQARDFVVELFMTVLRAAALAFLIIYFVAQANIVHGQSMEPNLHGDQRLIVEKVSYRFTEPTRGDVVVVRIGDTDVPLIKRVVALPGETVEIRNNQVIVNGVALEESYLPNPNMRNYGPLEVPEERFFVMGDNRNASRDSRVFGPISEEQIVGRAWVSFWPVRDIGLVQ